jgi:hypothetical protein
MSEKLFQHAVRDWLEDGSDRTPRPAIDAVLLAVKTTPQERDLRIPWRFPRMTYLTRATGIAAVALVAVVGAGALIFLNAKAPIEPGATTAPSTLTQAPSVAPTNAPTPAASEIAPGITGWTTYTSVNGFDIGYPDHWMVNALATRAWQAGDSVVDDLWPFADTFASPDGEIGLWVFEMPAGEGADIETVPGLQAWADANCTDIGHPSCEDFAQAAVPMCLNAGGDNCRAAILVPTAEGQYGFFLDWGSAVLTSVPDRVRVVFIGREDGFPQAARYGGSVELLKSILTQMDVWTPGQQPAS